MRETKLMTKDEVMAIPLWERCKVLADTFSVRLVRSANDDDKDMYDVFSRTLLEVLEAVNDDGK